MNRKKIIFIISFIIIIISILSIVVYAYWTVSLEEHSFKQDIVIGFEGVSLDVDNNTGQIYAEIDNTEGSFYYIRVKFIMPESIAIEKKDVDDWYWKDDYLYYKNAINGYGQIFIPDLEIGDNYNIGICAEAVPASVDDAGEMYPDFDWKINYETE